MIKGKNNRFLSLFFPFFDIDVFDKKELDGEIISSTRIRGLLRQGAMEAAAKLLGQPYMIFGEVDDLSLYQMDN